MKAIAAADANHDGILDLLAVQSSGSIVYLSNSGGAWSASEIARVPDPPQSLDGEVRLRIADLDNNGAFDLLLAHVAPANSSGTLIWLADDKGRVCSMRRT